MIWSELELHEPHFRLWTKLTGIACTSSLLKVLTGHSNPLCIGILCYGPGRVIHKPKLLVQRAVYEVSGMLYMC